MPPSYNTFSLAQDLQPDSQPHESGTAKGACLSKTFYMRTNRRILQVGILTCSLLTCSSIYASELEDARAAFIEWSKVKSQLSKEKADWVDEEALLEDMILTSEAELGSLEERIEELENGSSASDKQKGVLLEEINEAKKTSSHLQDGVSEYEKYLIDLLPKLPEPLKRDLQQLTQRLPYDAKKAERLALSQRFQTVVGILAQIEKFHSQISLVSEIKETESGKAKEVKTIYFGLSHAYFADAGAEYAGFGYPQGDGWKRTSVSGEIAENIAKAIAVNQNDEPPVFVSLPIKILD